jgi:hypothetical protein
MMKKLKMKHALLIIISIITGLLYSPIYIAAWILRIIARLLLAVAYFGLLQFSMGKDVFISLFKFHDYYIT